MPLRLIPAFHQANIINKILSEAVVASTAATVAFDASELFIVNPGSASVTDGKNDCNH
jgi:hypothetical protein